MIITDLAHLSQQAELSPALAMASAYLKQAAGRSLPDGRVDIDGEDVYALVQSYETLAGEPRFEAHRRYIDIQYVVSGAEIIGWAPLAALVVTDGYDRAKDIAFGCVEPDQVTLVRLPRGPACRVVSHRCSCAEDGRPRPGAGEENRGQSRSVRGGTETWSQMCWQA